jgi:outer membrane protein assembly factor BamB
MHLHISSLSLWLAVLTFAAFRSEPICAEHWPHWRGPTLNGASTERGLPSKFSKTDHVLWSSPMPGAAAATPIVWGDRVFISSVDQEKQSLLAMCLNASEGKLLWQSEIAPGVRKDDRSNFASGSPTTDGELVFFYYGNGDLVAFDFDGKRVWARNIQKDYGPFAFLWTFSSSPTLHEGKLILQVLQRNEPVNGRGRTDGPNDSYILALDAKTGRELWKQIRPSEARQESFEAYSTPIPYRHEGRNEILILGGDSITGHDPSNGRELWRWGTYNPSRITHWRMVVSPVTGGGVVLACAPKGAPVYAFKSGLTGEQGDAALAWVSKDREVSSDVSTPLYYKDRFFILNSDRRVLSCVEPESGNVLWTGKLESRAKLESSPTAADDKIYMVNMRGDVFVVEASSDKFNLLHSTGMGEERDSTVRSSVAIANGKLFIRTADRLYCIGR